MRQQAINYAKALLALTTDKETVDVLGTLPGKIPSFIRVLSDPLLSGVKKGEIIDDISKKAGLSDAIRKFLRYLCDRRDIALLAEIAEAYDACWDQEHHILRAEIVFAKEPEKEEMDQAVHFLEKTYPGRDIRTTVSVQEELLGGLCIRVGHTEYDWSYEDRLRQLARKLTVR